MRRPVVMGNWKLNGSKAMVTDLLNGLNAELEVLKVLMLSLRHQQCIWIWLSA